MLCSEGCGRGSLSLLALPEEGASWSPLPSQSEDLAAAWPRSVCHFSFIICSLYTGVIRDSFGFPSSRH